MGALRAFGPLIGRVLISTIFLLSSIGKIMDWNGSAHYMAAKGVPLVPLFLSIALLLELAGGLMVLTGFRARTGALLLMVFLIPVTVILHNFWALDGMDQYIQRIMFLKNLAILGGLLMIYTHGSGPFSLKRDV
ncbi:MAG: DoxX family protein [Deltaproteobacteria bacterium]|nr:DoxX family protein [Deltaproteobacteria bacterium]